MNDDENDELSGIFDHLTPEDFTEDFGPNHGRENFRQFVDNNINVVKLAYQAANSTIDPYAILADSATSVVLTPDDGETLDNWVARVRREARKIGAKWVFICRKTLVGNYSPNPGDDIPDLSDPVAIAKAIEKGLLVEGMFVYAERLENGEKEARHGIMKADGHRLGELIEGDSTSQTVQFFSGLLG